jgi:hypothetical protein
MPEKSWKPSLFNSLQLILLMSTTILSSAAAGATNDDMTVVATSNLCMLPSASFHTQPSGGAMPRRADSAGCGYPDLI